MYNTKNYSTDGGDTLVIGGKLVVGKGAQVEGIRAANITDSTASSYTELKKDFNDLLTALKDGGLMVGDAWDISTKAVPGGSAQMPTPETISSVITVALNCEVSDLEDADHGEPWGTHKWLGFGVDTGLDSIVGATYNDIELTQVDATEASDLGLSAGDFVLYIKAEDPAYLTGEKSSVLDASAHDPIEISIKITETKD